MIRLSVPEIEGGSPERDGEGEEEGEGLVLGYSRKWMRIETNLNWGRIEKEYHVKW